MRNRSFSALAAAALLAGLAGCSMQEKQEVRQDVKGMRQELGDAAARARKATWDAALAGKVKAALGTRKGLDARGINVSADGPAVTLKGDVTSPEQAELAEKVATETEGVESVRNMLTMRIPAKSPVSPTPSSSGGY